MVRALVDPFAGYSDAKLSEVIARAVARWEYRWFVIRAWRDLRYGRDDVLSSIPESLRATQFQYHAPDFNNSVLGFANFAAAGKLRVDVTPSSDRDRTKAEDQAAVLQEVLRPGGVLDVEQNDDVPYAVWENAGENGQGLYKVVLKRDYPLAIPMRYYADAPAEQQADVAYEANPLYAPRTRVQDRQSNGTSRLRETTTSYEKRKSAWFKDEFPFEWRHVDADGHFDVELDGVVVGEGDITLRPLAILDEMGRTELKSNKQYTVQAGQGQFPVIAGAPTPAGANTQMRGDSPMITCVEFWTRTFGCFGFLTVAAGSNGIRGITFAADAKYQRWNHVYRRTPYFRAYGPKTTDPDIAYKWSGAFDGMLAETPMVNTLETMHHNSVYRSRFPRYQLVKKADAGMSAPLNVAQTQVASYDDAQATAPPPGYEWQPIPSGAADDLLGQLEAARGRLNDNALAAVLRGITAPGDSGAKVSFTINAAGRALDPFKRRHETCLGEIGTFIFDVAKRAKLDLNVDTVRRNPATGRTFVKATAVKYADIVSTNVKVSLDLRLPVDQGAMETRGMALLREHLMSYESAAPEFFGIADPIAERDRIDFEIRMPQLDELAFQQAAQTWASLHVSNDTMQLLGQMPGPARPAGGVGGGPAGAYGGASRMIGRGDASTAGAPGGPQVDVGRPTGATP